MWNNYPDTSELEAELARFAKRYGDDSIPPGFLVKRVPGQGLLVKAALQLGDWFASGFHEFRETRMGVVGDAPGEKRVVHTMFKDYLEGVIIESMAGCQECAQTWEGRMYLTANFDLTNPKTGDEAKFEMYFTAPILYSLDRAALVGEPIWLDHGIESSESRLAAKRLGTSETRMELVEMLMKRDFVRDYFATKHGYLCGVALSHLIDDAKGMQTLIAQTRTIANDNRIKERLLKYLQTPDGLD